MDLNVLRKMARKQREAEEAEDNTAPEPTVKRVIPVEEPTADTAIYVPLEDDVVDPLPLPKRILNQPAVIRSLTQSILQFTMSISTVLKIAGFNLSARILSAPDWIFRSGSHLNCSPLMRKSIFVLSRTSRRNIRKSSAVP